MSIQIAVCDDDKEMLLIIVNHLKESLKEKNMEFELKIFKSGNMLLSAHEVMPFQVIFLDISMPGTDGFEIAQILQRENKRALIIFVTSKEELVYQSFDYQPFHFIRKGKAAEMKQQFKHVTEKLADYYKYHETIELTPPYGCTEEISVSNIIVVQSEKNYLEYELVDGETIRVRESLTVAEENLKNYDFIRISSRILINANYISRMKEKEGEVVLKTGYVYSISRNCKKSVIETYMRYLRSRK